MDNNNNNRKKINESVILITGLVRNGDSSLKKTIEVLHKSYSDFKLIKWLIIESDSNDNTLECLDYLQKKISNFEYISHGDLSLTLSKRTERIAYCRNTYIDKVNNNENKDVDYVCVADLDGVNLGLTKDSVLSCWESKTDWDMCSANQKAPYYDIWALRHKTWCPNDCWLEYADMIKNGKSHITSIQKAVFSKMITLKPSLDFIEVSSSFGGLAIYKKELFRNAKYVGTSENGIEICEHVHFHSIIIKEGYKLFINTGLVNGAYNEHSRQLLFHYRLKNILKEIIKFLVKRT